MRNKPKPPPAVIDVTRLPPVIEVPSGDLIHLVRCAQEGVQRAGYQALLGGTIVLFDIRGTRQALEIVIKLLLDATVGTPPAKRPHFHSAPGSGRFWAFHTNGRKEDRR